MATVALLLLGTACQKESSAPYLDFIGTSTSLTTDRRAVAADTFEVRAFAEARNPGKGPGLQRFTITAQEFLSLSNKDNTPYDAAPLVYYDTVFSQAVPPSSFLFINRFSASTQASNQDWVYTVTDTEGRSTRRKYRIAVRPADSAAVLHTYSVRLQAPRTTSSRAVLSALRGYALPGHATNDAAYQALADLVYVPTTTGPSLASPNAPQAAQIRTLRIGRWQQRRITRLAPTALTIEQFNGQTTATSITTTVDAALTATQSVVPVAKGTVVAFRTADGLKGLVAVSDVGSLAPVDLILNVKILRI